MKTYTILGIEFAAITAFISFKAIKKGYWPWPGTIAMSSLGFAVISILAVPAPELAVALGTGYVLVDLVQIFSNPTINIGLPPGIPSGDIHGLQTPVQNPYTNSYLHIGHSPIVPGGLQLPTPPPTGSSAPLGGGTTVSPNASTTNPGATGLRFT